MNDDNIQDLKYDEDEAIKFIRGHIPSSVSEQYSDDEITYVIDTIWDYYESKGLVRLNKTLTENMNSDIDSLLDYIRKEIAQDDEIMMDPKDIKYIVEGELAYEESIEMFDD